MPVWRAHDLHSATRRSSNTSSFSLRNAWQPFEPRCPSFQLASTFGRRALPARLPPDAGFVVCVPGRRAPQYSSQTVSCVARGQPAGTGLSNRPFLHLLEGVGFSTYVFWKIFLKRISTIRRLGLFLGPRVLNALEGITVCVSHHCRKGES